MQNTRNQEPSRVVTVQVSETTSVVGSIPLQGQEQERPRVSWDSNVVDNEFLGKKSSKICCIYHKPKSSFDSSSDEDSENDNTKNAYEKQAKKNQKSKSSSSESKASCKSCV
jgi:protein phosphatase 1 regulatory subunit 11